MVKLQQLLLLFFCVLVLPGFGLAQNISPDDVARVAEQFNRMSEQDKAILLNVAKQKYDALSDQEKKNVVQQAKEAVKNTPYENQILPLEKKLHGDDIPEAMKSAQEKVRSIPQAMQQPAVQKQVYQKPPLEQYEAFMQENESRLSDNQKKGMEHWKEQLEAQEKMHQQYMNYMQKQGQQ